MSIAKLHLAKLHLAKLHRIARLRHVKRHHAEQHYVEQHHAEQHYVEHTCAMTHPAATPPLRFQGVVQVLGVVRVLGVVQVLGVPTQGADIRGANMCTTDVCTDTCVNLLGANLLSANLLGANLDIPAIRGHSLHILQGTGLDANAVPIKLLLITTQGIHAVVKRCVRPMRLLNPLISQLERLCRRYQVSCINQQHAGMQTTLAIPMSWLSL